MASTGDSATVSDLELASAIIYYYTHIHMLLVYESYSTRMLDNAAIGSKDKTHAIVFIIQID
jgi:hypothetical protein